MNNVLLNICTKESFLKYILLSNYNVLLIIIIAFTLNEKLSILELLLLNSFLFFSRHFYIMQQKCFLLLKKSVGKNSEKFYSRLNRGLILRIKVPSLDRSLEIYCTISFFIILLNFEQKFNESQISSSTLNERSSIFKTVEKNVQCF